MKLLLFIFSMNRALQLDALFRSMKKHFKGLDHTKIIVYYKYTDENYFKAYANVIQEHEDMDFYSIQEVDITKDVRKIFEQNKDIPYACMACDDNIFINDFSINGKEFKIFEDDKNIACLSMRMYPNITKCYTAQIDTPPPVFKGKPYIWDWTKPEMKGDWSYPTSIDFHIFRMEYMINNVVNLPFKNVNHVEAFWASHKPYEMPYMICCEKSSVLNVPMNRVQTSSPNINMNIDPEILNKKYLDGYRIDIDSLEGFKNESPHQPVGIRWIGEKK